MECLQIMDIYRDGARRVVKAILRCNRFQPGIRFSFKAYLPGARLSGATCNFRADFRNKHMFYRDRISHPGHDLPRTWTR